MIKRLIGVAAGAAIAVGSIGIAAPALATPGHGSKAPVAASQQSANFSDADVVQLLALGSGPIVERHPELAAYVQTSASSKPTSAELKALTALFDKTDPNFHRNVTIPLQSGDPYAAAAALNSYVKTTKQIEVQHGTSRSNTAVGDCLVVGAAGVLVVVAVSVWVYLWGPSSTTSSAEATQEFSAALATSLGR